jgi:hypothetical protein
MRKSLTGPGQSFIPISCDACRTPFPDEASIHRVMFIMVTGRSEVPGAVCKCCRRLLQVDAAVMARVIMAGLSRLGMVFDGGRDDQQH